ncbi:mannose transport/utilization transcriptional regulator ManR [Gottschalkiaceae bacterium SANA]|nr:mannose transport/utilization transcriptional regulator ManR [Gottschalkiaceae bacterium SANA]
MKTLKNKRSREILKILATESKPLTINTIAMRLDVSNRSIRNDLNDLDAFLQSKYPGIQLFKKPRIGVWLETDTKSQNLLNRLIKESSSYTSPFSAEDRRFFLIKKLLLTQSHLTMQQLADELFVSRVTVYNDLEDVETWLKPYEITLKRKQKEGVSLHGNEQQIRNAMADLLDILKTDQDLEDILQINDGMIDSRIDYVNYLQLKELFPDTDLNGIETILKNAERDAEFPLAEDAFTCLLIHIAISMERIKKNKDIKMESDQLLVIQQKKEYEIARKITKGVEEIYHLKIPEAEVGYISLHILGSKMQQGFTIDKSEDIIEKSDDHVRVLAKEIINLVGIVLSTDLHSDQQLLTGLILHLRPTINRLKYGLRLKNPLLDEIKLKYPSIFGAAWSSSVLFEKYYGIKVTEEEVAYLAMHFGAALERKKTLTRAVIVCSSGIGTAQLAAVRLEHSISDLKIIEITSVNDVSKIKSLNYDIIISTIPLRGYDKPVVLINPLVSDRDIQNIRKYINNVSGTKNFQSDSLEGPHPALYSKELIYPQIALPDSETAIRFLGNALETQGAVIKGFAQSCLEREKITNTSIGFGIAIPHGEQPFVTRPSVAILTLDKPITWGDESVDILFMLAFKFDDSRYVRKFFKRFYAMIRDKTLVHAIRTAKDSDTIYQIVTGKEVKHERNY